MPVILLAILFALVAVLYAAVGFGGGSSYNALLVLSGMDYRVLPSIALTCNILVVSGGVYHFHKLGFLSLKKLLPFVVLSVPLAWYGGQLAVQESTFVGLLGLALLLTGIQLMWGPNFGEAAEKSSAQSPWIIGLPLGGGIGLLSGIIGIGGGIFLAPVLYFLGWGKPKHIAALASGFILVNSMAGLAGQLMKHGSNSPASDWIASWPLFLAVLIGGQLGSRLGSKVLPESWIQKFTAVLILYVAARLLMKWLEITGGL